MKSDKSAIGFDDMVLVIGNAQQAKSKAGVKDLEGRFRIGMTFQRSCVQPTEL